MVESGTRLLSLLLALAMFSSIPIASAADPPPIVLEQVVLAASEERSVPARDEGSLKRVAVELGQTVQVNDILAELEDAEAGAARDEAAIELQLAKELLEDDSSIRLARKTLALSESELQRAKDSNAVVPGGISETRIDELRLRKEEAEIRIEQLLFEKRANASRRDLKQSRLAAAEARLAKRRIVAPIAGEVVEVLAQSGEWVQPGQIVLRIVRRDQLQIDGFLSKESRAYDYRRSTVELSVDVPGRGLQTYPGRIVFVSPVVETSDGRVRFRAVIDNSDGRISPGQRGRLTILGKPAPQTSADVSARSQ